MRRVALAIAAAMALGGCKREVPPPGPPTEIPGGYPIPAGAELAESAVLGRLATFVYQVPGRAPAEVIGEIRAGLELLGWPVRAGDGAAITRRDGKAVTATASAEGAGTRLVIEVRTPADAGVAPAPAAAPLAGPPPGYPLGFPFIAGATGGADGDGVVLDYPDREPAALAAALRERAERQRWMCTQGAAAFVCAAGGRTVDVRVARRGAGARLTVRTAPGER